MRRDPGEARLLGLWTAGCLFVLLLIGVLWVGDLSLQWPVFAVPLLWAAVAMRPRRGGVRPAVRPAEPYADPAPWEQPHPETREAPTLPPPPTRPYRREW